MSKTKGDLTALNHAVYSSGSFSSAPAKPATGGLMGLAGSETATATAPREGILRRLVGRWSR